MASGHCDDRGAICQRLRFFAMNCGDARAGVCCDHFRESTEAMEVVKPRTAETLLDWGDSGVGHPLLDQPAFLDAIAAPVSARCGRTGCNNGAQLLQAPIPPEGRSCLLRSLPRARR